jgi:alkaline phosphatase D
MKLFYPFLFLFFLFQIASAQTTAQLKAKRSAINPSQYPFYHGVASGDPLSDRVILWTRITLDPLVSPVSASWQIATDSAFSNIVNNGTVSTDSTKDYTIKVDATGLQQNTWYYYRFIYNSLKSVTGRTRTLPTGSVNNLRFAVASCQDYQNGYYNAYRHMSQRNDLDAVLFLGDYIYEDNVDSVYPDRLHEPDAKAVQIVEYRIRHSQYRLDPDLQAAHQQYPWICVWDDHETANNSYTDGAKNHTLPNDGPWYDRKVNGVEAYYEWMPIRVPNLSDTFKIFRRFTWGDLADLNMIDTRIYERDKQAVPTPPQTFVLANDSVILDSTRTMIGMVQADWLKNNLTNSAARWQVLGQQVIMTPLVVPAGVLGPDAFLINSDQWDGYPFERQKLYDHILNDSIDNIVVLTGDIHTGWANDLPLTNYSAANRQNSIGVEFVTPSITSNNELPTAVSTSLVYALAPHVRYLELVLHGYMVLDLTTARAQSDFVFVNTIGSQSFTVSAGPSWYANNGEKFLREASTASVPMNTYPPLAQLPQVSTGINTLTGNITTISVYPNPFYDEVVIQFNVQKAEEVTLEVYNQEGKRMTTRNLGLTNEGLNYAVFNGNNFPSGFYLVELKGKSHAVGKAAIKVN